MPFRELTFNLLERPPKFLQRLARYTDSIVFNPDDHRPGAQTSLHRDGAAIRREFYRIGKKIEHDLFERATVRVKVDTRLDVGADDEPFFTGACRHHANTIGQQRIELDGFGRQPYPTGFDFRHVEDVIDYVEQILA